MQKYEMDKMGDTGRAGVFYIPISKQQGAAGKEFRFSHIIFPQAADAKDGDWVL